MTHPRNLLAISLLLVFFLGSLRVSQTVAQEPQKGDSGTKLINPATVSDVTNGEHGEGIMNDSKKVTMNPGVSEFDVLPVDSPSMKMDAKKTEAAWEVANSIRSFVNPWNTVCPETVLSMIHDKDFLYFFFDVKDHEIVLLPSLSGERDIEREDRVELFFSKDPDMREYCCFEIDAKGRVLSYRARHYRDFDFSWEPPEGFHAVSQIHTDGYSVEGCIPLGFLKDLIHENSIFFGAYRADFSKNGDSLIENWQTWKAPETDSPDFHVPASLGIIHLR